MTARAAPARVRVTTLATTRHTFRAWCDDCGWSAELSTLASWPALRELTRRHAQRTNHTPSAEYRTVHVYGVTATAPA